MKLKIAALVAVLVAGLILAAVLRDGDGVVAIPAQLAAWERFCEAELGAPPAGKHHIAFERVFAGRPNAVETFCYDERIDEFIQVPTEENR